VGFWKDPEELSEARRDGRTFDPRMEASKRDELYGGWKSAVRRVLTPREQS
jgi:glycerol kinase